MTKTGKIKYKGAFKTHSEMIKDGEYHKAFNQGIVPLALSDFYLKEIPIEETIKNHTNIYDFCKTFNATHGWLRETFLINSEGLEYDIKPEQKNNRYYLSKKGRRFRKVKEDRKIEIEANRLVTIFNKYEERPFHEYGVDLDYYIDECYKIIHILDGTFERQAEEARIKREEEKRKKEEENFLKFCINKVPTEKQLATYRRDWLIHKYGEPIPKITKS